jgi:1-acyl-sn-glycerol-3-phosphate acyltransferase
MPLLRSVANASHALGWTVFMSSLGITVYSVTGNRPVFRRMTRFWAEGLAKGWGMRVHSHGAEQLDPDGTYVFLANHLSHVDIVALFVGLPVNVGFLAKKELKKIPFLGQAMVAGGHVFIDRKKHASALRSMSEAAQDVKEGASIVIFPEGTRGLSETIQSFKKGGVHLARAANVPIVPVGLRGTRSIMGRENIAIRPGDVHVHIGAPVDPASYADPDALTRHLRERVGELAGMPLAPSRAQGRSNGVHAEQE